MSRLSSAVLIITLMVSLLFIYLGPGDFDPIVGIIALLILGLGLILGFTRGTLEQREGSRKMLATLTGIVAVASAALMGQFLLNGSRVGLACGPILLMSAYTIFLATISRAGLNVEEGEVLLIQRRMDHQHIIRPPGLHSPMITALEAGVAVMPTYNIQTEVEVESIDTAFLHKVNKINVDTTCRIIQHFADPGENVPAELRYEGFLRLPYNYPNRDNVFKLLAEEMNLTIAEARMNAEFWIRAIQRQVARDVDEELRNIIHDATFYDVSKRASSRLGPTDISARRNEVAAELKQRLQEKVQQWGVEMLDVSITQVELDPDRVRTFYRDKIHENERRDAKRKAEIEAEQQRILALAELELTRMRQQQENDNLSNMVSGLIDTMRRDNPNLTTEDIEHVLFLALEEQKRLQYRSSGNQGRG